MWSRLQIREHLCVVDGRADVEAFPVGAQVASDPVPLLAWWGEWVVVAHAGGLALQHICADERLDITNDDLGLEAPTGIFGMVGERTLGSDALAVVRDDACLVFRGALDPRWSPRSYTVVAKAAPGGWEWPARPRVADAVKSALDGYECTANAEGAAAPDGYELQPVAGCGLCLLQPGGGKRKPELWLGLERRERRDGWRALLFEGEPPVGVAAVDVPGKIVSAPCLACRRVFLPIERQHEGRPVVQVWYWELLP